MSTLSEFFENLRAKLTGKSFGGIRVYVAKPDAPAIFAQGEEKLHDPASLTKLMTFYLANRAGNAAPETISISPLSASYSQNKTDILKVGDSLPWKDALGAMMIASDNRAAGGIAEALGAGRTASERQHAFVKRMNEAAKELDMVNTRFANPNGMPLVPKRDDTRLEAHTTAADMAKLIDAIYRDFPQAAKTYLECNKVTYKNVTFHAHHGLNTPEKPGYVEVEGIALGAKTGFTNRAMFNIASRVTAADGSTLDVILLGVPPTDIQKAQTLVERSSLPAAEPVRAPAKGKRTKTPHAPVELVKGYDLRDAVAQKIVRLWAAETKQDAARLAAMPPEVPFQPEQKPELAPVTLPALSPDIRLVPESFSDAIHGLPDATRPPAVTIPKR